MGGLVSLFFGTSKVSKAAPPRVSVIDSSASWQDKLNSVRNSTKLMVIDFTAAWCGPCKFISPFFSEMSSKYTDVDFVKIDVDKLHDIANEYEVKAMPTFVFVKNGQVVDRVAGAHKEELENKIKAYG